MIPKSVMLQHFANFIRQQDLARIQTGMLKLFVPSPILKCVYLL